MPPVAPRVPGQDHPHLDRPAAEEVLVELDDAARLGFRPAVSWPSVASHCCGRPTGAAGPTDYLCNSCASGHGSPNFFGDDLRTGGRLLHRMSVPVGQGGRENRRRRPRPVGPAGDRSCLSPRSIPPRSAPRNETGRRPRGPFGLRPHVRPHMCQLAALKMQSRGGPRRGARRSARGNRTTRLLHPTARASREGESREDGDDADRRRQRSVARQDRVVEVSGDDHNVLHDRDASGRTR